MDNNDTQFDMIIQPYIEFALLKGLTFKSQLNMQMSNSYNNYFKPSGLNHRGNSWGSTPPIPTAGAYTTGKTINWQFENFLNYQNSFGKHNLGGLLGNTMEHYNHYSSILEGFDYPGDRIKTLNACLLYTS